MERDGSKVLMQDMTEGKPLQLILGFAIPMLLGMLFQQFYSMVDTIIVGKFLGVDALASVGSTSAVNFMVKVNANLTLRLRQGFNKGNIAA